MSRVRWPKPRGDAAPAPAIAAQPDYRLNGPVELEPEPRKPRRSPQLRVLERIDLRPVIWDPKPGLPAGGRAECKTGERPCPYVRCKFHLWRIDAGDRVGRRPRAGETDRRAPATTLLPAWLEHPTPACCALDVADAVRRHEFPVAFVAKAMHLSSAHVWDLIAVALKKVRAVSEHLGEPDVVHTLFSQGVARETDDDDEDEWGPRRLR